MMPLLLTASLLLGILFICMSVPLIQRKVAPNLWYGFRTRRTLEDPNVWYPANVYAAWRLLWVGVAIMIVAIVAYFIPNVESAAYTYIITVATVLGVVMALIQSFIYLSRLTAEDTKKPTGSSSSRR